MIGASPAVVSSLPTDVAGLNPAAVRAVSEEFEAVFLATMMQHMFAGVATDGPFGGGRSEETWRSLLIEEYGKSIASAGGIGIADQISRELLALQEMTEHDAT
jgi:peptidoglycan hydrolase FlgJ